MSKCVINLYLDKRYKNKDGKHLVRLSVFTNNPRKRKFYKLDSKFVFSLEEYEAIWKKTKKDFESDDQYKYWKQNKKFFTNSRLQLTKIEAEANEIANSLPHFTFEEFEKIMFSGGQKAQRTISFYYKNVIDDCKANNRYGTAENYSSSLKSLIKFRGKDTIYFEEITPEWLRNYERWMLETQEKSRTTIGIYLRPLRAIFNKAIADNVINDMAYPFGKNKYKIPAPRPVKKALNKQELKTLMNAGPENEFQEKARDLWFFSFACNGINLKDVAYLKWKDLKGDEIHFLRSKTVHTSEGQRTTTVYLNDFANKIIKKYGTDPDNPNSYVFPILKEGNSIDQDKREIGNLIRFINQHIKKLAKEIGIDPDISYQWARHSFATYALENNAGIELISESLGHSNIKTTQNYLNGFSGETKKKLSESIMKF